MCSVWIGRIPYMTAWRLQRELARLRGEGSLPDTLLLLEHPPTITLGRGAHDEHVLASEHALAARGVDVHRVDRGGDVTYHGPGQLVGYPIVDLAARGRDLHRYLRDIEAALICALDDLGLQAGRFAPHTGVWIGQEKVAAIGVKVSHWVSTHGFALNVCNELDGFRLIVPCGIAQYGVTSVSAALGRSVSVEAAVRSVESGWQQVFGPFAGDSNRVREIVSAALTGVTIVV